jgi:DNA segregation ATPase FtsK/SpoIIIE-like protein
VANVFAKTNLSTRVAFRVPHHNDSVTLLGYKGAESLPDVRGRGLIVWKGKFIEFQSFEVTYPMPSPEVLKSITEKQAAVERDATVQDNDQSDDDKAALVLELYEQGKSNTAIVYEIWGTSGSSFAQRMKEVKEILATAATATASESANLPLKGTVSQQQ